MLPSKPSVALILAVALTMAISLIATGDLAYAIDMEELSAEAERTSEAYNAACAERDRIAGEISSLEENIAIKEAEIANMQTKADDAAVALYKLGNERSTLIEMLLDSHSLQDILYVGETYAKIEDKYKEIISTCREVQGQLEDAKVELNSSLAAAQIAVDETGAAAEAAKAARKEAQEQIVARQANESDAALAAEINWDMGKEEFVAEWGSRIDVYLAGSPLDGYGPLFAESAYNNGADPRFSPAISRIESNVGRICFAPFNAWGWMSRTDFTSWDQAIPEHVHYLCSSIYGTNGYLTRGFASTYCPPNAQYWWERVGAEMRKI